MTNLIFSLRRVARWGRKLLAPGLGAIAFYTCLPIPVSWQLSFHGIARWAPIVGLLIGALLGSLDVVFCYMGLPIAVRSALIVVVGIALTGGLHLDGAMDTADGLAVIDPERRLAVMADSRTGAFGAMAAIAILLLKTTALSSLASHRWLVLMLVAGWGRWGQLVAIARYPYLKAEGKGALHKTAIHSVWAALPSGVVLIGLSCVPLILPGHSVRSTAGLILGGLAIALLTGAWFNHKLGGHTGDTYGAVVEWTEALLLCVMTGTD